MALTGYDEISKLCKTTCLASAQTHYTQRTMQGFPIVIILLLCYVVFLIKRLWSPSVSGTEGASVPLLHFVFCDPEAGSQTQSGKTPGWG